MYFVRTASERDLEQVRALLSSTWHATYDAIVGVDKVDEINRSWHSLAALKTRMQKKGGEFLVADNGRDIGGVGYAAMSDIMSKTAVLSQLCVKPSCQRQGIGRDLFAELETCFPDAEIMRVEVYPENTVATAFFAAHGFVDIDRTDNSGPGQSGIPALILEKTLAS